LQHAPRLVGFSRMIGQNAFRPETGSAPQFESPLVVGGAVLDGPPGERNCLQDSKPALYTRIPLQLFVALESETALHRFYLVVGGC
jgi:hypothetical protein